MRNDVIDGIQNNLPRILFERQMQVKELAILCDTPYTTMHNIVTGKIKSIKFEHVVNICQGLNIDISDIYEIAQPNKSSIQETT